MFAKLWVSALFPVSFSGSFREMDKSVLYLYRCLQILIAENGGCVKKAGNGAIFCKIRAFGATACVAVVYARSCAEWLSNALPSCCKQALFALQASLACDAECVCFERKTAGKRWKSMPFIYNKVLKRHEKAVAPSGGNSVTGMPGVKYFYRAAAWLVVYSPLSGLNAECEKALPIGKNRRVVFVSLAVLGGLCCAAMAKKKVYTPCLPAWRH